MKNVLILIAFFLSVTLTNAQTTTESAKSDTLRVRPSNRTCTSPYCIDGIRVSHIAYGYMITDAIDKPIITMHGTTVIERKQLISLPQRNINAIAGLVAGVDSRAGEIPNIRGARQDGTAYFVDGMRIRTLSMPNEININMMK